LPLQQMPCAALQLAHDVPQAKSLSFLHEPEQQFCPCVHILPQPPQLLTLSATHCQPLLGSGLMLDGQQNMLPPLEPVEQPWSHAEQCVALRVTQPEPQQSVLTAQMVEQLPQWLRSLDVSTQPSVPQQVLGSLQALLLLQLHWPPAQLF